VEDSVDADDRLDRGWHSGRGHAGADTLKKVRRRDMLFDPNWKQHTPSLEQFAAWLRARPADGTYVFSDGENCAMAQFLHFQGQNIEPPMPSWYLPVTMPEPHTFGAALKRASML
jgi:hypothetical protein